MFLARFFEKLPTSFEEQKTVYMKQFEHQVNIKLTSYHHSRNNVLFTLRIGPVLELIEMY